MIITHQHMNELMAVEYDIGNYILIFIQLLRVSLEHAHKHRYTRINEEKNPLVHIVFCTI